jgi:hypothetical protein
VIEKDYLRRDHVRENDSWIKKSCLDFEKQIYDLIAIGGVPAGQLAH